MNSEFVLMLEVSDLVRIPIMRALNLDAMHKCSEKGTHTIYLSNIESTELSIAPKAAVLHDLGPQ